MTGRQRSWQQQGGKGREWWRGQLTRRHVGSQWSLREVRWSYMSLLNPWTLNSSERLLVKTLLVTNWRPQIFCLTNSASPTWFGCCGEECWLVILLSSKKTFSKNWYSLSLLKVHIVLLFLAWALCAGITHIPLQRHMENRCYAGLKCAHLLSEIRGWCSTSFCPQTVIQPTYWHQTSYIINNI